MSDFKSATERKKDTLQIQKKVIVMFELSANLMRLLEIVCMSAKPDLFLSPANKVPILCMLCVFVSFFSCAGQFAARFRDCFEHLGSNDSVSGEENLPNDSGASEFAQRSQRQRFVFSSSRSDLVSLQEQRFLFDSSNCLVRTSEQD
jgi:hypothetical protein